MHVAIAPTKQIDRIEWFVEKAIEIGIDEISFIKCKNSERTVVKIDRIKSIAESAVKQSKQAFIPKINELTDFSKIVLTDADLKCIAHCNDGDKLSLKNQNFKDKSVFILIGPEGDFTTGEVELANKNSFVSIELGVNRLRTETAGLYAVQAVSILT
ncbi:MAG: RNA methyltransferase [Bacteroidia bacterium]|nr:RNA methyltransferase [Bacteroidia bacterium]